MKSSYLDFINEEEAPPFDPVDWQMQKPRVVQERGILDNIGSFLGDRLSAIFSPPSVDLGKWATQDPDAEEGRYEPPIEDVIGTLFNQPALGITSSEVGRIPESLKKYSDGIMGALAKVLDNKPNSISKLEWDNNPAYLGRYLPEDKSIRLSEDSLFGHPLERTREAVDTGLRDLEDTLFHERFHNTDHEALQRGMGLLRPAKAPVPLYSASLREGMLDAWSGGKDTPLDAIPLEKFMKELASERNRAAKKGLPKYHSQYGWDNFLSVGDATPIWEILASLAQQPKNFNNMPKGFTDFLDRIEGLAWK